MTLAMAFETEDEPEIMMMVQFGSQERTLEDWTKLFEMAEPRLRLVRLETPEGSADSLMELMLVDAFGWM